MTGNVFGSLFRLTSFGESHEKQIGGVIEGFPPDIIIDEIFINNELERRNPSGIPGSTKRIEADKLIWLSGIKDGQSTGMPIKFIIENENFHSRDYNFLKDAFRPSHADYTYFVKYGKDNIGGGRSSGRETAVRVVGGALAKILLNKLNISCIGFVTQLGKIKASINSNDVLIENIERSVLNCPDKNATTDMIHAIEKAHKNGDTLGGEIKCILRNIPVGLGEPVFDKLEADLAKAMLSIPSVKGFEVGSGFGGITLNGSEYNDIFIKSEGKITTKTNHDGGIQGGISNGNDIVFNVAFKPISSIRKKQLTIDKKGNQKELLIKGRHDVCVVPRAVVIVESMAAMVVADHWERHFN